MYAPPLDETDGHNENTLHPLNCQELLVYVSDRYYRQFLHLLMSPIQPMPIHDNSISNVLGCSVLAQKLVVQDITLQFHR